MPYPLLKMAYGLRCRLSDLTTAIERYHLQIAADNVSICPPELQIVQESLDYPQIVCKHETVSLHRLSYTKSNAVTINPYTLINCTGMIRLHELNTRGLKSDIFGHFLCDNATFLAMESCNITKPFFETLKTVFPKITNLICYSLNTLNFVDLLTTFPNLKKLNSKCPLSKDWMVEILQVGKHSLMDLVITNECLEQCYQFNFDEFLKLLKAQRRGFKISIERWDDSQMFRSKLLELKQYLNQKLERGDPPSLKKRTQITIDYEGESTWYVPLKNDNQNVL